jgi:secreted PhoX family phosphatase
LLARPAAAARGGGFIEGYGALRAAGELLALPPGFQYSVVSYEGDRMDDGFPVPKAMDGMAAFPLANGNLLLIRNHEDAQSPVHVRPRPAGSTSTTAGHLNRMLETHFGPRSFAYDQYCLGGTTSIEVDPRTRRKVREHWSLVGTFRNCAGGSTPWGSWLSCEETFEAASSTGAAQNHGYVFEVPVTTTPGNPAPPTPLRRLGRMAHEAAAVDPETGIVYETEDQGDVSGFYRFIPETKPTKPGDLAATSGRLEMLKVNARDGYETAVGQTAGVPLAVSWVPISDPDPTPPTVSINGVTAAAIFQQGLNAGGAIFRRLEGLWYHDRKFYFTSTNGGDAAVGQVWIYDPRAETITLMFESPGIHVLDFPDNMTVSPRGGIVLCEDGGGTQHIRGLTASGGLFDFARNLHNTIEFAGACFSPDGQTLFVNLYGRSTVRTVTLYKVTEVWPVGPEKHELALTLAIWGPWGSGLI